MGEPLETRRVGLGEWLQQSFYIAPAVRSQHALKPKRLHLANTLIASTYAEVQAAAGDRLNPRFVVERYILPHTSDQ